MRTPDVYDLFQVFLSHQADLQEINIIIASTVQTYGLVFAIKIVSFGKNKSLTDEEFQKLLKLWSFYSLVEASNDYD